MRERLISDHSHFSSYEGHMERRMGKIRGTFSRMHRALDGWMLARAPASPAQGLHHHGPRYYNFHYFCTMCFCFCFVFLISLIADGPHHYHPACGHKGSSYPSPVHALQLFIAMQVQHSYKSSTNGWILLTHVPTRSVTEERTQILLW